MISKLTLPSPLQTIEYLHNGHIYQLAIKRDDLIHQTISGNKWRKLKYHLERAKQQNIQQIVSFGGAFSNHLHALAYACMQENIRCHAVVRGENASNSMLHDCQQWGMTLSLLDRKSYQQRHQPEFQRQLLGSFDNAMLINEGGYGALALQGVGEIIAEAQIQTQFTQVICPVGSGTTLAGLALMLAGKTPLLGVCAIKNGEYLRAEVNQLLPIELQDSFELETNFHFGGFAKLNSELIEFCLDFKTQTGILLDPIYTAKAMLAMLARPPREQSLFIHTGGLQGWRGMLQQKRISTAEYQALTA